MADTFFFYDLETSGVSARSSRIMQFAGQRTDMDLKTIGEPINLLIKLTEDVLPEPDAILITGITPQQTIQDGITEAEFFRYFSQEIAVPGTIFVGFNSIRFDDEFIRYGLYRNFYDPYEWQWKNGSSKWDILDVVRLTRALRPDGIEWPFASDGKPSNRLELLTSVNKLEHSSAHDALSDVNATIAVARLIKEKQSKIFEFLLSIRNKRDVETLVNSGQPFVYASGQYSSRHEKTTIVWPVGQNKNKGGFFVYDLRHDPKKYIDKSVNELVELWRWKEDREADRLRVKTLQLNKCPAIAPMTVLKDEDKRRLEIDTTTINKNLKTLRESKNFYQKIVEAAEILEKEFKQTYLVADENNVDAALYDGFVPDIDKLLYSKVQNSKPNELMNIQKEFSDERLKKLLPLYKARNFPKSLSETERSEWEEFKNKKISEKLPKFGQRLQEISSRENLTKDQKYLIEELQLYAESLTPY